MTTAAVKTVLITGAGSGIGLATAHILARAGHTVYASMRSIGERNRARADELRAFAYYRTRRPAGYRA